MFQNLAKKVQENIFRHKLFERNATIIVGVSGGPDSVCLLDVLNSLKGKYSLSLVVAHVNYGLRGKDSELDEKLVKKLAKKYSLPIEILRNNQHKPLTANLEERLRNIRYAFFEKTRVKYKASLIAVGHNLNDQAETVLLRILRGSGLRGIGAIKFKNRNIIRPLLNIERKAVLRRLKDKKAAYRFDKSNFRNVFTRNKIRNKLLPYLEKEFNPNIQQGLYRLSQSTADDYDFIGSFSKEWLERNKKMPVSKILALHPSIQREVLRQAIEKLAPNLRGMEAGHIDEIFKILRSTKGKNQRITLKGLKISRIGDKLLISKS